MSELTNVQSRDGSFRRNLLTNVSVLALLGVACASPVAAASPEDRPTVWIELGGQLERLDTGQAIFAPPFFGLASSPVLDTLVGAQRPSRYSTGAEGKVRFASEDSDWVFSAAVRYGRVKNRRNLHYQTAGLPSNTGTRRGVPIVPIKPVNRVFGDSQAHLSEAHFVVDFQAGRDVGLGLFGDHASSIISAGVRYAQFTSGSDATLYARPVYYFGPPVQLGAGNSLNTLRHAFRQTYTAVVHAARNSHGIGPSALWEASMPVIGREQGTTLAFDWGVNAAVLFGRQRVEENHQVNGTHLTFSNGANHTFRYSYATAHKRSRAITIPNVGGFVGVSLRFPNAKVSLGYRGDFFFNATDSGFAARDAANRNFYGPFATIGIGLGG